MPSWPKASGNGWDGSWSWESFQLAKEGRVAWFLKNQQWRNTLSAANAIK